MNIWWGLSLGTITEFMGVAKALTTKMQINRSMYSWISVNAEEEHLHYDLEYQSTHKVKKTFKDKLVKHGDEDQMVLLREYDCARTKL